MELNQAAQVEAGEVTAAEAAQTLAALRFTSELDALRDRDEKFLKIYNALYRD